MDITAFIPASSLVKGILEDGLHVLKHGDGGLVGENALVLEHCMDFFDHRDYVSYYSSPWHCSVSAGISNPFIASLCPTQLLIFSKEVEFHT